MRWSEFEQILDVSATTSGLEEHFDLLSCFLRSAITLHATACDGIASNNKSSLGKVTNDVWNEHLITAFYLFRHSFELAIKALIKETQGIDLHGQCPCGKAA